MMMTEEKYPAFYLELAEQDWDLVRLSNAWQRIVQRHSKLQQVTDDLGQVHMAKRLELTPIQLIDLRQYTAPVAAKGLIDLRKKMQQHDFTNAWPFYMKATQRQEKALRLHICFNSQFIDAKVWQVLQREWVTLYQYPNLQLLAVEASAEPSADDKAYWAGRLATLPTSVDSKKEFSALPEYHYEHRYGMLSAAQTTKLAGQAQKLGVSLPTVLFTLFSSTLQRFAKETDCAIYVNLLNRLPLYPFLGDKAAFATSLQLLPLTKPEGQTFAARLRAADAALRKDLPHLSAESMSLLQAVELENSDQVPVVFTCHLEQGLAAEQVAPYKPIDIIYHSGQVPHVPFEYHVWEDKTGIHYRWSYIRELAKKFELNNALQFFTAQAATLANVDDLWHQTHSVLTTPAITPVADDSITTATAQPPIDLQNIEQFDTSPTAKPITIQTQEKLTYLYDKVDPQEVKGGMAGVAMKGFAVVFAGLLATNLQARNEPAKEVAPIDPNTITPAMQGDDIKAIHDEQLQALVAAHQKPTSPAAEQYGLATGQMYQVTGQLREHAHQGDIQANLKTLADQHIALGKQLGAQDYPSAQQTMQQMQQSSQQLQKSIEDNSVNSNQLSKMDPADAQGKVLDKSNDPLTLALSGLGTAATGYGASLLTKAPSVGAATPPAAGPVGDAVANLKQQAQTVEQAFAAKQQTFQQMGVQPDASSYFNDAHQQLDQAQQPSAAQEEIEQHTVAMQQHVDAISQCQQPQDFVPGQPGQTHLQALDKETTALESKLNLNKVTSPMASEFNSTGEAVAKVAGNPAAIAAPDMSHLTNKINALYDGVEAKYCSPPEWSQFQAVNPQQFANPFGQYQLELQSRLSGLQNSIAQHQAMLQNLSAPALPNTPDLPNVPNVQDSIALQAHLQIANQAMAKLQNVQQAMQNYNPVAAQQQKLQSRAQAMAQNTPYTAYQNKISNMQSQLQAKQQQLTNCPSFNDPAAAQLTKLQNLQAQLQNITSGQANPIAGYSSQIDNMRSQLCNLIPQRPDLKSQVLGQLQSLNLSQSCLQSKVAPDSQEKMAVVSTAQTQCSFGSGPQTVNIIPMGVSASGGKEYRKAWIDFLPYLNEAPKGACSNPAFPPTAAATAAAFGALTPMPCIPVQSPYMPGALFHKAFSTPVSCADDKAICLIGQGGNISVTNPGQETIKIK